jgi:hypothetical protein
MRYRKLDDNDDMVFGYAPTFLVDTPQAVAQAVKTRLRLFTAEWFLDNREGLDLQQINGYGTQTTRDREVQQRILGTPGVTNITRYLSSVDRNRKFSVYAEIDTIYGIAKISEVL